MRNQPIALPNDAFLRRLESDDAPELLAAYRRNQEHLRRFEPARPHTIVRGVMSSASVGYWVDVAELGPGLATAAVAALGQVERLRADWARAQLCVHQRRLAGLRTLSTNP